MNLIQELIDGTVEYKDNGVTIRHPPTSTMLKAARAIKQLLEQHEGNMKVVNDVMKHNQEALNDLQQLRDINDKYNSELSNLRTRLADAESVRDASAQEYWETYTSGMGNDGNGPYQCNSNGQGDGATSSN